MPLCFKLRAQHRGTISAALLHLLFTIVAALIVALLRRGVIFLLGLLFNRQQIHFFYLSSWSSCIFCPGHVDSPNLQNCAKTVGQKLRKFDVYFLLIHNSIDVL